LDASDVVAATGEWLAATSANEAQRVRRMRYDRWVEGITSAAPKQPINLGAWLGFA
jgi:hypothetical protein